MATEKTNEQLLQGMLEGMGKKRLLDYLTTVTMFYFVEGDWEQEHKQGIHACYLELSYFLEECQEERPQKNL